MNMIKASPHLMRKWVEYLALDIGPRPYSEPYLLRTLAEDLSKELYSLGYVVELQPVSYQGNEYFNVVASTKKAGKDDSPLLVVGAHYDSVETTPGADDNASGVAGLLELARILAETPPPNLRLVFFTLEEPPTFRTRNMGSYVYAKSLKKEKAHLMGMICLEMIGYFSDKPKSQSFPVYFMERYYPDTGNFIAFVGNRKSRKWTMEVKKAFMEGTNIPTEHINAPWIVIGVDFSDHWSFYQFGFPAVMVTDTAFYRNSHYHRFSDVPETLNFDNAAKVVDGLAHAIMVLSGGV
jgi:Zn-dependent M28 family amino/carboxypeptidase